MSDSAFLSRYAFLACVAGLFLTPLTLGSCKTMGENTPVAKSAPRADVRPHTLETHGQRRIDEYYWLREREDPDVIAYLEAENEYTESIMAPTEKLQEELFEEIKSRIRQDDSTVPVLSGSHYYYTRYEEGKEYAIHCRQAGSLAAKEQILLDGNAMAEGHDYFAIGRTTVSKGEQILAYAVDTQGRRIYTIRFKNLDTGEDFSDVIDGVTGGMAWALDDRTLFYARQDAKTLRSHQIYRHVLGTAPEDDVLVYEEADEEFNCYIARSKSKRYLFIASYQTLSSEFRYLDATTPEGEFQIFEPRSEKHEYSIDHAGDHFWIRSNLDAKNFRLLRSKETETTREHWEEVIPHRDDVLIEDFELFSDHVVVEERKQGLIELRVRKLDGSDEHYIDFGEPTYKVYMSSNFEVDHPQLRFVYTSLTTPNSVYDYDLSSRKKTLRKRYEVLGGFDSENYATERLWATARDGKKVPISIVYRKGLEKNGQSPLLLYGYGSYGHSIDATFNAARLSLIDRGFTFAIAHIRGGEDLGREWYESGKLLHKMNTFTDFIDCAEHLVAEKFTSSEHLYALGGSAGGLLIGAVINLRPDLFSGVHAAVPFVDVVTTMLDDSIPLTTNEYDEWGNPNDKLYFDYMMSYSPYDNVAARDYPHILVTTGLHDSQVQYWEPAKWVARLRTKTTGDNRLLLKTEMAAGHGGVSGRYKRYKETAFEYAFFLDLEKTE